MAAVQGHAVLEHILAFGVPLVARVAEPPETLQQDRRAQVFFAVPPVRRAGGRAAGAQDTFVQPVELFAVEWGLAVFFTLRVQGGLGYCVLCWWPDEGDGDLRRGIWLCVGGMV